MSGENGVNAQAATRLTISIEAMRHHVKNAATMLVCVHEHSGGKW